MVNLFDLTETVDFDWNWFTGKNIVVEYTGSSDNQDVYVLHTFFDVEYRKRERVFSDEVTADVIGQVDDNSGTITGTPDALITRPDHARQYVLQVIAGLPSSFIDTTSFGDAGTSYDSLSYAFAGIISADATARETEKVLERILARLEP